MQISFASTVTIETKRTLFENKKSDIFQLEDFGSEKKLPTILEDMGPAMVGRAISMSPVRGSQGGHEGDQSSQEEAQQKIHGGQEQLAVVTEAGGKEAGVDDNTQDKEQGASGDQMSIPKEAGQLMKVDSVDLTNVWEGYSTEGLAVQGKFQELSKDEWPKWQEVRQSKRIRANATF